MASPTPSNASSSSSEPIIRIPRTLHYLPGQLSPYLHALGAGSSTNYHQSALLALDKFMQSLLALYPPHLHPPNSPSLPASASASIVLSLSPPQKPAPDLRIMNILPSSPHWDSYKALLIELSPLGNACSIALQRCLPELYRAAMAATSQQAGERSLEKEIVWPLEFLPFDMVRVTLNQAEPLGMRREGEGWVVSCFLGEFEGGEMQVSGLWEDGTREVFRAQYGDVLVMKESTVAERGPYKGKRYQLDFFVGKVDME